MPATRLLSAMVATWNNVATTFTGIKLNVTDTASAAGSLLMDLQVGGVSKLQIDKLGSVFAQGGLYTSGGSVRLTSNGGLLSFGASNDVILARDAANTLALRNGTAAQTFNVYNTYTDASNYERLDITWASNFAYLRTASAGTGAARGLVFGTAGSAPLFFQTGGLSRFEISASGHFVATTDNTYDIGANGANRPRNVYVAGLGSFANYVSAGGLYPGGSTRTYISSGSDGTLILSNNAGTNSVTATVGASNLLTLNGGLKTTGATFALQTATTLTDNAAAQVATMTNGPTAGNPTKWIAINDNGVTRYIPAW